MRERIANARYGTNQSRNPCRPGDTGIRGGGIPTAQQDLRFRLHLAEASRQRANMRLSGCRAEIGDANRRRGWQALENGAARVGKRRRGCGDAVLPQKLRKHCGACRIERSPPPYGQRLRFLPAGRQLLRIEHRRDGARRVVSSGQLSRRARCHRNRQGPQRDRRRLRRFRRGGPSSGRHAPNPGTLGPALGLRPPRNTG